MHKEICILVLQICWAFQIAKVTIKIYLAKEFLEKFYRSPLATAVSEIQEKVFFSK